MNFIQIKISKKNKMIEKKQYKKDFTMDTNYERTKRGANPE